MSQYLVDEKVATPIVTPKKVKAKAKKVKETEEVRPSEMFEENKEK